MKEILLGFLLLHLIMAVVGGVFYVLTTLGMTGAAMLFKPEAGKISSVLIGREYIQMAMGVFTGGVQMTGTLAFADTVYSRLPGKSREEVPLWKLVQSYSMVIQTGKEKSSYNSFTFADRSGRRVSGVYGSQP